MLAMPSRVDICNQAVGLIGAKPIQSVDEQSLEARECRRFYPQVIATMLEGPHDWSFANRRVALAALVTNPRSSEWLYAYGVPADMGTPIRLIPDLVGSGLGFPVPLPGEPYAETWATGGLYQAAWLIENGVLYANVENATLEYGIKAVEEAVLTALAVDAIATDLAYRLAVPVKKDRALRRQLMEEADLAWQRAMADDANRQPRRQGDYVSEAMAARAGWHTAPHC